MTSLILIYALLAAAAALSEAAVLSWLLHRRPAAMLTENYRGREVLGRAGVTLLAPLLVSLGISLAFSQELGLEPLSLLGVAATIAAFIGLGWLDDAYGSAEARGLKGHIALLLRTGKVTTGLVKAGGGALAGAFGAHAMGVSGWTILLAAGAIALSANTVNSLDARPGRALKAFAAGALIVLGAASLLPPAEPWAMLLGLLAAAVALASADFRERAMLGDSGANPLGCALGMAVVSATPWPVWAAVAAALLGFCLAADRWSLTALIESAPLLRRLDERGTVRAKQDRDRNDE